MVSHVSQASLDNEIVEIQRAVDDYHTDSVRADKFIELVKRYTEFTEFSAVLLNEFIEKVIVHEREKKDGIRTQQVDIYLNFIGKFDVPISEERQSEKIPARTSKKKLRRDMTGEERTRERQRDHERYAKKVAERKAKEQAVRAEI